MSHTHIRLFQIEIMFLIAGRIGFHLIFKNKEKIICFLFLTDPLCQKGLGIIRHPGNQLNMALLMMGPWPPDPCFEKILDISNPSLSEMTYNLSVAHIYMATSSLASFKT